MREVQIQKNDFSTNLSSFALMQGEDNHKYLVTVFQVFLTSIIDRCLRTEQ